MGATRGSRLETKSIVIGYAMSRLDNHYLAMRHCKNWRSAYEDASCLLGKPPATFKNLRDEFDPLHLNPRKGWRLRPLRLDRLKVLEELRTVSDEALFELVQRILAGDEEATGEAIDSLVPVTRVASNVAERLLTGRRAEEYFLTNSERLMKIPQSSLIDMRQAASGYDFGVAGNSNLAIEIKGIRGRKGDLLFTDQEWTEARIRGLNYFLVVVGNLPAAPKARIICNPRESLHANCRYQRSIAVNWCTSISL